MTKNIITNTLISSSLKLLVFEIGKLTLALPIKQVQKVIRSNQVYGSGLSHVHLSHLGEQEITIVDLHHKLFNISQVNNLEEKSYFIITKNVTSETLGIIVNKTPSLVDITVDKIRPLPHSYRRADTLEIASHVAVITQENNIELTIFILDLEQLIDNTNF